MASALVEAIGEAQYKLVEALGRVTELEARVVTLESKTNNRRKLSPTDVNQIKRLSGSMTQRELSEIYRVNSGTISRIVNNVYHKGV